MALHHRSNLPAAALCLGAALSASAQPRPLEETDTKALEVTSAEFDGP